MNVFDEKEFMEISRRFGGRAYCREIVVNYSGSSFFNKMKNSVRKDRRGEVVFCVVRPNGKIITITCEEYPKGIFRIPTGGIGYGEDVVEAVHREVMEELGLEVEITDFAGVLKIMFRHGDHTVMFYSYIFILREKSGRLLLDASDNEISEVREVDMEEFKPIVDKLADIPGKWHDWGSFRYETTKAVYEYFLCLDQI